LVALAGGDRIEIREAQQEDAEALAHVHVASWQTTYRGIIPDSYLDTLTPASRLDMWHARLARAAEGECTFVAEVRESTLGSTTIVGFSAAGSERDGINGYDSELWAIYLLKEYRGRGIGRQLAAAATSWLVERGKKSLLIWVLKDNYAARGFYEALGGQLITEKQIIIGGNTLAEVADGWPYMIHASWRRQ